MANSILTFCLSVHIFRAFVALESETMIGWLIAFAASGNIYSREYAIVHITHRDRDRCACIFVKHNFFFFGLVRLVLAVFRVHTSFMDRRARAAVDAPCSFI